MLLNTVGNKKVSPTLPDPNWGGGKTSKRGLLSFILKDRRIGVCQEENIRALRVEETGGTKAELKRCHGGFHFAGKSSILPLLHKLHVESK